MQICIKIRANLIIDNVDEQMSRLENNLIDSISRNFLISVFLQAKRTSRISVGTVQINVSKKNFFNSSIACIL